MCLHLGVLAQQWIHSGLLCKIFWVIAEFQLMVLWLLQSFSCTIRLASYTAKPWYRTVTQTQVLQSCSSHRLLYLNQKWQRNTYYQNTYLLSLFTICPDSTVAFLSGIRQVFWGKSHSFSHRLDMENSNRWAAASCKQEFPPHGIVWYTNVVEGEFCDWIGISFKYIQGSTYNYLDLNCVNC